jgi:methionine-gamma-lyase
MVEASGKAHRLSFIYLETPANPTSGLFDIEMCREIADYFGTDEQHVNVAVDNTYMGPLWSHPLQLGADLVIYSATKYIGGHSDLLAGAVLGNAEMMKRVKTLRTFLGSMASPHTSWLLLRSLETLKIRMEQQARNAAEIAELLNSHAAVGTVRYLGNLKPGTRDYDIFRRQYTSAGAMIAFEVVGGEKAAFQFMNTLKLIKIAVSLGGTESLIEHPDTMTHAGVCPQLKEELGVNGSLVRLSIGVENSLDLMQDIELALAEIPVAASVPELALA